MTTTMLAMEVTMSVCPLLADEGLKLVGLDDADEWPNYRKNVGTITSIECAAVTAPSTCGLMTVFMYLCFSNVEPLHNSGVVC